MTEMPTLNEHHQRLARLAGKWIGEEKLHPTPWGPGRTSTGRYDMRLDIDGFFIIQDYVQEAAGKVTYRGHGIFGWDDRQENYTWYWVDSMGFVPEGPSRGRWEGDTLTLEHPPFEGKRGRYTFKFGADDTFAFKIENSHDDGKSWTTFMEGQYRKQ